MMSDLWVYFITIIKILITSFVYLGIGFFVIFAIPLFLGWLISFP